MSNKKFVAFKKRSKGTTERKWFKHCEQEKIPYVIVSMRTKYADISFDYISLPKEYDAFLTNHAETIWKEAHAIFKKYAVKKSKFGGGGLLIINFENIPIDNAEFAANELFDLINLYLKKYCKIFSVN